MSSKKTFLIISLVLMFAFLLSACASEPEEGGLICVIVPGVENPFFGSMQEIAAAKAEELVTRL